MFIKFIHLYYISYSRECQWKGNKILSISAIKMIKKVTVNTLKKISLDKNLIDTITNDKAITIKDTYLLANGVLNPEEEVKFELRLWLNSDAPNETMKKKFTAVVSSVAYATEAK